MKFSPSLLSIFVFSFCLFLTSHPAQAQDTGIDARERAQIRSQEEQSQRNATEAAELARHRCCRCFKGTEAFCTKLTGALSCTAYRQSSNFQSLPRVNQVTLAEYTCTPQGDPLSDTGCEPGTAPTPPAVVDPAHPAPTPPPTPPTAPGAPPATPSCPHTFADFTAAAAEIRPIVVNASPPTPPFVSITPTLGVQIPGLSFSPARREGPMVFVPFLAQYIAALERYAVGLAAVAAIIMIVYGGFRYLLGSAFGDIAAGKQIILDAIVGLLLVLGAYTILNTINPNTLEMPEIKLGFIEPSYFGEGEGNNEPIRVGASQSCRCSPIPQGINEASVLKVPCYRQYDSAWGALPFGTNLLPVGESMNCSAQHISYSATLPACSNSTVQPTTCMGTLGQGGCGPTSLAVVLAYYGIQANGHLITPLETAQYAVLSCLRPQNGGMSDICSPRSTIPFAQRYPGFTCTTVTMNKVVVAAREINAGHPVIFHCAHCMVTKRSGNLASGSRGAGHYMVLTGVNTDHTIFSVHDVGHEGNNPNGDDAAIAISGDVLNSGSVSFLSVVTPTTQLATPTAAPRCTDSSGRRWGGSGSLQAVSIQPFTYCPGRGEGTCSGGWDPNRAWFMYPTRLESSSNQRIRLYIYIHGYNHDIESTTDGHTNFLRHSLQKALTNKDIVIAAPHWYGNDHDYMHGFNLEQFYAKARAAILVKFPHATIVDIAVGGHSAATCNGTLKQALNNNTPVLTRARGFVVYDGCPSDGDSTIYNGRTLPGGGHLDPGAGAGDASVNGQNFSPHGFALIVGPDAIGMGLDNNRRDPVSGGPERDRISASRTSWGFNTTPTPCPPNIPIPGVECYAHPRETRRDNEWWEVVTHVGHPENVEVITDIAFRAFYGAH